MMSVGFSLSMSLGRASALDHWVLIELYDVLLGRAGAAAVRHDVPLWGAVDVLITALIDSGSRVHVIVDETLALEEVLAALLLLLAEHALAQLLDQLEDLTRIKGERLPAGA